MIDPLKDPATLAANLRLDADDMRGLIGKGILARVNAAAEMIEALATTPEADPDDDALDGVLFRFWIRAASYPGGWPSALAAGIEKEIRADGHATPAAYRRALLALAKDKGVNLPG